MGAPMKNLQIVQGSLQLHGPFEAASAVQLDLDPHAWPHPTAVAVGRFELLYVLQCPHHEWLGWKRILPIRHLAFLLVS